MGGNKHVSPLSNSTVTVSAYGVSDKVESVELSDVSVAVSDFSLKGNFGSRVVAKSGAARDLHCTAKGGFGSRVVAKSGAARDLHCIATDFPRWDSLLNEKALYHLGPCWDECGTMRIGGRLARAVDLNFIKKFPVILPCPIKDFDKEVEDLVVSVHVHVPYRGGNGFKAEMEALVSQRFATKFSDTVEDPPTPMRFLAPHSRPPDWMRMDMPEPDHQLLKGTWNNIVKLTNAFRNRFIREYLPTLHSRMKWNVTQPSIRVGQLVLLVDTLKRSL